ncbi:hypothetical protein [Halosegnis longus]|uniref:DUF8052 domain-containing protein n=1 Tax=Halosegnis longus TaxID=2216012 RepID=A0AAJ4R6T3_9EURY|nr:hypothetical protein [Halosegnis longus]RNJ25256.1 hypothetical protein Nmn1133_00040 [Salella cibi]
MSDEPERPTFDDEYLDDVAARLVYNYDLDRDKRAGGQRFELYGRLRIQSRKQFLHESINYANQNVNEHLFATRRESVSVGDIESAVELGHELAETGDWITADETHRSTDFTFVFVVPAVPEPVREFVHQFRDRTLLRYGYNGHYEVNLVVVAPEEDAYVASEEADVWRAFAPWADSDPDPEPRLIERIRGLLTRK